MIFNYTLKNLFIAELLGSHLYVANNLFIYTAIINIFLIYLIAKILLGNKFAYISLVVTALSPWLYYLTYARSFYIFLLFPELLIILGLLCLKKSHEKMGNIFIITGAIIGIYSSVFFLPILITVLVLLLMLNILSKNKLKFTLLAITILSIPLFILIDKNRTGIINTIRQESKIFSDPGLINSINRYQGAAETKGLKTLSRISENKYLFYSEFTIMKYMSQLVPEVYFSPKYKLLHFSFNPPIFIGFAIPFFYGLYKLLNDDKTRKTILISTLLTIPSILAKEIVAINRLVLFAPIILLIISYGIYELINNKSVTSYRNLRIITFILVIFQLIVTLQGGALEGKRFQSYFGDIQEITEP